MSVLTPLRLGRRRDEAAELQALQRRWSNTPVGEARLDAHVRLMLRRCGVTSGRVLEIGSDIRTGRGAFGPGFTCHVVNAAGTSELKDGTFDVVVSIDVFEQLERPRILAAEITRILAPGGLAYTSTHDATTIPDRLFDGLDTVEIGIDPTGTTPRVFHAALQPRHAAR